MFEKDGEAGLQRPRRGRGNTGFRPSPSREISQSWYYKVSQIARRWGCTDVNVRWYVDNGYLFPFDPTGTMYFAGYEVAACELHLWGIGCGEVERPAPDGTMCLAALAERWEMSQRHVRAILVDGWLERTGLGFITVDSIFDVEEMGMVDQWQARITAGESPTPYLVQAAELEIDWPVVAARLGVSVEQLRARHRHGLDLSDHYHDAESVQSWGDDDE